MRFSNRILAGIFFQSAAALMLEVSLSRLLAIMLWYHFAFLIISCALLGYGASGAWFTCVSFPRHPFVPACLFTVILLPLFLLVNHLPFDPTLLFLEASSWLILLLFFLLLSLPFFLAGLTLNLLLQTYPEKSFSIYSWDLFGGAAGCAGFFLIAGWLKEIEWIVIVCLVGCASSIFFAEERRMKVVAFSITGILMSLLISDSIPDLKMNVYKNLPLALQHANSRRIDTKWDGVSRIDWFKSPIARFAAGLSLNYRASLPEQTGITVDGDQLTAYSSDWQKATDFLSYLPLQIQFEISPEIGNVLILRGVGGQAIHAALKSTATEIWVQTENNLLAESLRERKYGEKVKIKAEKVRTYLAQTRDRFDRIIVPLEGALPTGMSGMSMLQESTLETVEGMTSLLTHLSVDGWLSIHRFMLPPPRAESRLIATIIEAMKEMGWDPAQHLGVFRSVSTLMILVSNTEWEEIHKKRFLEFCENRGYTPVYYPGIQANEVNLRNRFSTPIYAMTVQALLANSAAYYRQTIFNIAPVYDDRPFFYSFLKLTRLAETLKIFQGKWEALFEAGLLLPLLLILLLLISTVVIGFPYFLRKSDAPLFSWGITYFFWIGLGFMIVEIVLFEKLLLFLGSPVYSFALVLSGLLISSAIGSQINRRAKADQTHYYQIGLLICLSLYAFGFSYLLSKFQGDNFFIRLCVSVVSVGVLGLLMGMPFPRGIFMINESHSSERSKRSVIALAWCLNGIASVIASTGAIILAHILGFSLLFVFGLVFYSLAFLSLKKL